MRIGYAKLGRSMALSPAKFAGVGGDQEPPILLNRLARRNPEHEFVLIGRNSEEDPVTIGLPDNVVNPWIDWRPELRAAIKGFSSPLTYEQKVTIVRTLDELTLASWVDLDAVIVWAGQHGTSNSPIPVIGGAKLTNPQDAFVQYASYVVRGISVWRDKDPHNRQEIWLNPDPRNFLKCRDLKWPPAPVLAQYDWKRKDKHYRYDDPTDPSFFGCTWDEPNVWKAEHEYIYSGLEIVGIPSTTECNTVWEGRDRFGSIMNETRAATVGGTAADSRFLVMKDWVLPNRPSWIAGTWSQESQKKLGVQIRSIPWHTVFPTLNTVHATLASPAVGTGWATAKPWEAFACGTVVFFHPKYDTQNHVLGRPGFEHLAQWLRVDSPQQLARRLDAVHNDRDMWLWLINEQRRLFETAQAEAMCLTMIEERLNR